MQLITNFEVNIWLSPAYRTWGLMPKSSFECRASIISTQVLKTDYKSHGRKEEGRTTGQGRKEGGNFEQKLEIMEPNTRTMIVRITRHKNMVDARSEGQICSIASSSPDKWGSKPCPAQHVEQLSWIPSTLTPDYVLSRLGLGSIWQNIAGNIGWGAGSKV